MFLNFFERNRKANQIHYGQTIALNFIKDQSNVFCRIMI